MCMFIYCKCKVCLVAIHLGALKSWISVLMDRNDPQGGGIVVVCEPPSFSAYSLDTLDLFLELLPSAWLIQALHMRLEQQVNSNLY